VSTKAHKAMTDAAVITVAIAVAIAGFIALFKGFPAASSTEGPVAAAVQPDAQPAAATTSTQKPTTALAEQSISPAVVRTLAAQGSAWFLPTDQAVQMLPTSIVNVLESRGVVLQVQLGAG